MLQAQLRGKLTRREEDMEDLLTSNVFGSLNYLQPQEGLLPLLTCSFDGNGTASVQSLPPISNVNYEFWPWIQEPKCQGCEPDVLITIRLADGQTIVILVEAKYRSGKSSEPSEEGSLSDQLACEWDNLVSRAERQNATPIMLYVTDDLSYPKTSIDDSRQEYLQKRKRDMNVFWISWRKIPTLFSHKKEGIIGDLIKVLRKQGLTFYEGVSKVKPIRIGWSFKAKTNWVWSSYSKTSFCWQFRVHESFIWIFRIGPIRWRFVK